jgi:AGZA family xanthine/uracil permease-like MFS transporter
VYIGHPGWKAVGGRIGYSLATGIVIGLVCFLGVTALLLAVVPLVAILPILLFIGLIIGAQAFEATPHRHAPAVILAMLPNVAAWGQNQIDGALGAAGTNAAAVGLDKLAGNGVIYKGMELFGGGATLAGLILGAIAVFIIDREFKMASIYAGIGAVLAFFGFINGTQLAFGNSAPIALGYAVLAAICLSFAYGKLTTSAEPTPSTDLMPLDEPAE